MKFEQLLKIYWARSFLYGGNTQIFSVTFLEFFQNKKGIGLYTKKLFFKRFEFMYLFFKKNETKNLNSLPTFYRKTFNIFLSQLISINNSISDLNRYNLIRLFLIKSYRGRCHAIGKPTRGQRTWSNGKTSQHIEKTIRSFIQEVKKLNSKLFEKRKESLNKKLIKKKINKKNIKFKMFITNRKKDIWF